MIYVFFFFVIHYDTSNKVIFSFFLYKQYQCILSINETFKHLKLKVALQTELSYFVN